MKIFVAILLVVVYSSVDAATEADLITIRDYSSVAYSNLESGSYYLEERGYRPQVSSAVESLSTLNSLATAALPPLSYPVLDYIKEYDNDPALTEIINILRNYGPDSPVDARAYLDAALRYTLETTGAVNRVANS